MNRIHATALVSGRARLGEGNQVGPFVVIEEGVTLGRNNSLGAHCLIKEGVRIGDGNVIHEHGVIGTASCEDLEGRSGSVSMGDHNVLREGVRVEGGSGLGSQTSIGNRNYLMAYAQVGRDCRLADRIVVANNVVLGEQVQVESQVFISGGVAVGPCNRLGWLAIIGGNSKVTKGVLPFCISDGVPARVRGLNLVGLKRADFQTSEIQQLKQALRALLRSPSPLREALDELTGINSPHVRHLVEFVRLCKERIHR